MKPTNAYVVVFYDIEGCRHISCRATLEEAEEYADRVGGFVYKNDSGIGMHLATLDGAVRG